MLGWRENASPYLPSLYFLGIIGPLDDASLGRFAPWNPFPVRSISWGGSRRLGRAPRPPVSGQWSGQIGQGRILEGTYSLRDASSKGASSKGSIVQGKYDPSNERTGTEHTGTHCHVISVLSSVCTLWPNHHLQAISAATEYRGGGHFEQWLEERQLPPQVLLLSHKSRFYSSLYSGTEYHDITAKDE